MLAGLRSMGYPPRLGTPGASPYMMRPPVARSLLNAYAPADQGKGIDMRIMIIMSNRVFSCV